MLEKLPVAFGQALRGMRPGLGKLAYSDVGLAEVPASIEVESPAFGSDYAIPPIYTADGRGLSVPLVWRGVPVDARATVLVLEDADSPTPQPLVHAIALDLPPVDGALAVGALNRKGSGGATLGRNSLLRRRYLPPDPPPGHGVHRYAFQLFACDATLASGAGLGRRRLLAALRRHAIAKGCLIGTYIRA